MTSTVLPPATASAPIVRAMFPVPMMLMLLMRCPVLTDDREVGCSRLSGFAARWAACGTGYRWTRLALAGRTTMLPTSRVRPVAAQALPPPVTTAFLAAYPRVPVSPAQIAVVPPSATSSMPFT